MTMKKIMFIHSRDKHNRRLCFRTCLLIKLLTTLQLLILDAIVPSSIASVIGTRTVYIQKVMFVLFAQMQSVVNRLFTVYYIKRNYGVWSAAD